MEFRNSIAPTKVNIPERMVDFCLKVATDGWNAANGWRAHKPRGGCLMEVSSGEVISRGLSMPHSPRWHDGRLWLLEWEPPGTGEYELLVRAYDGTGAVQISKHASPFPSGSSGYDSVTVTA